MMFSAFYKENNSYDFLFAFLDNNVFRNKD